jgi:hypothetical protein
MLLACMPIGYATTACENREQEVSDLAPLAGSERLYAYLFSRRNRVACALALLAVALVIVDPVGPSGVLLVLGFYLLGALAARPTPELDRYGFDPKKLEKALQRQLAEVSGRVPPQVTVRIQQIELITRTQILPRLELLPPGSLDLYLVERTATDYVPTAVSNYLRLPADYASGGDQPLEIVDQELALLEVQMRRIAAEVQRADMDRLLAHRRFLNDRFAQLDASS